MFGSKKIEELEARLQELQDRLNQETSEKNALASRLSSANARISELESALNDFDLEKLKAETASSKAEYEGLRELYLRKNREFDDTKEEKEESFAREQAIERHNLETEIRENRQANQDYVTNTVKTFGESYNYYLNQIKVLMDALGNVATRTGEALFSGENTDLKTRFGSQMRDLLKSGAEPFKGDVIIGEDDESEQFDEPDLPATEPVEAEVTEPDEERPLSEEA